MNRNGPFRISQFGARVGRTATQLRKLDRTGVFPARRTITGQRYYTEADVERFLAVLEDAWASRGGAPDRETRGGAAEREAQA